MPRPLRFLLFVTLALSSALAPRDASAQRSHHGRRGHGKAVLLTPPKLDKPVQAQLPAGTEVPSEGAVVGLEITIDAHGKVTDVKVIESAGEPFDEAAAAAAKQFVFRPAERNGKAIPSLIRFKYTFKVQPPPPPPPRPTRGTLRGKVLFMKDGEPLAAVNVSIVSADGNVTRQAATDAKGAFAFEHLPAGTYRVRVTGEGLVSMDQHEEVEAGQETDVTYRLASKAETGKSAKATFGATAVVERPPREVTRHVITSAELTRIPGTRGDALRAVELLPGVARPPLGLGVLIVRGSSPDDSQVFFDGTPVPLLYHFGGLTSFLNSRLLEEIDFYPGNFSVRYGRKVGGILEVKARDPATDRFHGVADINVIDASILAEGPVGKHASVALAARRSYIDFFFKKVVPPSSFSVLTAPVYYDYQAFASWHPTPHDRLYFKLYGSSDNLAVILGGANNTDPNLRGNVGLKTVFHYAQASWEKQINDHLEQNFQVRFGPEWLRFSAGQDLSFDGRFLDLYARSEWKARLNRRVRLVWGLDVYYSRYDINYRGPAPQQEDGAQNSGMLTGNPLVDLHGVGNLEQPAFYIESDMQPWKKLRVILGLRLDYYNIIDKYSFDPRLAMLYSVAPKWKLKWGVGIFSEPPELQQLSKQAGNRHLDPFHAVHVSAGIEHYFTDQVKLSVEGFYKYLYDVIVNTPGGLPPVFVNAGIGRIYGLEVLGRWQPSTDIPMFAYLSYTLSRSERKDHPGDRWRLFDYDQTHIFTLAAVYQLPKHWDVGFTLRLVSGNPKTPIIGSYYDAKNLVYQAIYGPKNSARNPLFNRLDVRIEKKWVFAAWKLAVYLDVQNVYNQRNPEGDLYSFDYAQSAPLRGLPILPSLGVRGEM